MTLTADVENLRRDVDHLTRELEVQKALNAQRTEQISGEGGIINTMKSNYASLVETNRALKEEIKGVKKAMYWVGAILITSCVGYVFASLQIASGG